MARPVSTSGKLESGWGTLQGSSVQSSINEIDDSLLTGIRKFS